MGPRGARDAPPPVQFLSFSCSFRRKNCRNTVIGFYLDLELVPPQKILDLPLFTLALANPPRGGGGCRPPVRGGANIQFCQNLCINSRKFWYPGCPSRSPMHLWSHSMHKPVTAVFLSNFIMKLWYRKNIDLLFVFPYLDCLHSFWSQSRCTNKIFWVHSHLHGQVDTHKSRIQRSVSLFSSGDDLKLMKITNMRAISGGSKRVLGMRAHSRSKYCNSLAIILLLTLAHPQGKSWIHHWPFSPIFLTAWTVYMINIFTH